VFSHCIFGLYSIYCLKYARLTCVLLIIIIVRDLLR